MEATATPPVARAALVGRVLTAIPVLFLTFDALIKVVRESHAVEGTVQFGLSDRLVAPLGWLEFGCLGLYLVPRTAFYGAILWTGYLGGAVAMHVRLGNPLATHVLVPVYVATLLWAGLVLRDPRLRAIALP